jgi:hypothetical protein
MTTTVIVVVTDVIVTAAVAVIRDRLDPRFLIYANVAALEFCS